jgi:hypothetical protein
LIVVSISPVVFRWSRPFIVTCIFAVREPICYIH